MRILTMMILCAGLLAGCGKKPAMLDVPPAPPNADPQQQLPQQSDLMAQQRIYPGT